MYNSDKVKKEILKNQKVYVFIDAGNLWNIYKAKKSLIDFKKLKNYFLVKYQPSELQIFYYTSYPKQETRETDVSINHNFFTFLSKGLGFRVVKKPLKQIKIVKDGQQGVMEKGNMDVELAIDLVHNINNFDIALLFSGDSDFLSLANYVKNKKKEIYIYSSKNSVSTELETGGSGYKDIMGIEEIWGDKLKHKKSE